MLKVYLMAGASVVIMNLFAPITPGENLILFFILSSQYKDEWPK